MHPSFLEGSKTDAVHPEVTRLHPQDYNFVARGCARAFREVQRILLIHKLAILTIAICNAFLADWFL